MTPRHEGLRLEDRLAAEDRLHAALHHGRERGMLLAAAAVALTLHVVALLLPLPRRPAAPPPAPAVGGRGIVHAGLLPLPPQFARDAAMRRQPARRLPLPDPPPDDPEPIREPESEPVADWIAQLPPDVEIEVGLPEDAPQPPAPAGAASNPVLIEASRVEPVYPEKARRVRRNATVILRVVVEPDGSVGEIEVQRCTPSDQGFEEAAVAAVRQWRYRPAEQNGRRVAVPVTVAVEFRYRR